MFTHSSRLTRVTGRRTHTDRRSEPQTDRRKCDLNSTASIPRNGRYNAVGLRSTIKYSHDMHVIRKNSEIYRPIHT